MIVEELLPLGREFFHVENDFADLAGARRFFNVGQDGDGERSRDLSDGSRHARDVVSKSRDYLRRAVTLADPDSIALVKPFVNILRQRSASGDTEPEG